MKIHSQGYLREMLTREERTFSTRKVLLLQPPPENKKTFKKCKPIIDEIINYQSIIQHEYNKTCQVLEEITGTLIPKIKISILRRTTNESELAIPFMLIDESLGCNNIRAFTHPSSRNTNESQKKLDKLEILPLGISHLVSISCDTDKKGWYPSEIEGSVLVNTEIKKLRYLIIDILLDITMFHSWKTLINKFGQSIVGRNEFSVKKANFAIEKKLSGYYGDIHGNIKYYSLAAAVRKSNNFTKSDCQEYEGLWKELVSKETLHPYSMTVNEIVEDIVLRTKKGGHINRRKLVKKIEELDTGLYILLIASKRPPKYKLNQLKSLMRINTWKMNSMRIIKYEDIAETARLEELLTYIRFEVNR